MVKGVPAFVDGLKIHARNLRPAFGLPDDRFQTVAKLKKLDRLFQAESPSDLFFYRLTHLKIPQLLKLLKDQRDHIDANGRDSEEAKGLIDWKSDIEITLDRNGLLEMEADDSRLEFEDTKDSANISIQLDGKQNNNLATLAEEFGSAIKTIRLEDIADELYEIAMEVVDLGLQMNINQSTKPVNYQVNNDILTFSRNKFGNYQEDIFKLSGTGRNYKTAASLGNDINNSLIVKVGTDDAVTIKIHAKDLHTNEVVTILHLEFDPDGKYLYSRSRKAA